MKIFIDTSAFYALLDRDDANHQRAKKVWPDLVRTDHVLVTSSYALVETFALLQHRLGMEAVRGFHDDLLPLLRVEFVSSDLHRFAMAALLAASRRSLSLVDCASFEIMRTSGITTVFAFDQHFKEQGFSLMP